jgi:hypothetical protein
MLKATLGTIAILFSSLSVVSLARLLYIPKEEAHRILLAVSCLRLMSEHLKCDICGLHSPGAFATEVHGDQITKCKYLKSFSTRAATGLNIFSGVRLGSAILVTSRSITS